MNYIHRIIEQPIHQALADHKMVVLYGPRQVGKTTLAKHVAQSIDPDYRYLNCDEPDVALRLTNKSSTELIRTVGAAHTVVIDEAQRVENIGITLKLLADTFPHLRIIATGSSSFELSNAVNEPLTGRAYYYEVWPFALTELAPGNSLEQERLLSSLLVYGGYPAIALNTVQNVDEYLANLTQNYLYRDLLSQGVIRSETVLRQLLQVLALQIGGLVSLSELGQMVGAEVATVKRLIELLEKAFVIHRLLPLLRNQRDSIKKQYKIYFTDLGVRNQLIGNVNPLELRSDIGALWENFCVNELRKNRAVNRPNDYFWRNYAGAEVDYVREEQGKLQPFEFKWAKHTARLPRQFAQLYDPQPLQVISRDRLDVLSTPEGTSLART